MHFLTPVLHSCAEAAERGGKPPGCILQKASICSAMHAIARLVVLLTVLLGPLTICRATDSPTPDGSSLLSPGFHHLPCSSPHSSSLCGRAYYPDFLSPAKVSLLLSLATSAFELTPGGSGPVTIVDMISGALSYKDKFINLFSLLHQQHTSLPLPSLGSYLSLTSELAARLSSALQSSSRLYLTRPSFFSRIRPAKATSTHDEYWHPHIDREQYGTFEATALIYLSEWGDEFEGGEFVFVDTAANRTIDKVEHEVDAAQTADADTTTHGSTVASDGGASDGGHEWVLRPSLGALAFFSSGTENVHYVRRVTSGTRYALTIAFTRNEEDSVEATLDVLYGPHITDWHARRSAEQPDQVEEE